MADSLGWSWQICRPRPTSLLVGWLAYASTYLLRKPLGVMKSDLATDLGLSVTQLGLLDLAFILPYAVFQTLLSNVGDIFGAQKTLCLSLILSAFSMMSFGWWSSFSVLVFLLFISGTAQSQSWPCCSKVLSSWFKGDKLNSVFGVIGTSSYVGGMIGTSIAVYLQSVYTWRNVFIVPFVMVIVIALLVSCSFKERPVNTNADAENGENVDDKKVEPKLSWLSLWKISLIPEIAIALFCLKLVRYALYMWLPMYLYKHLGYFQTEAGLFSTMFEVGGIVGSFTIGYCIDKMFGGRSLEGVMVAVFLGTLSLLGFIATATWGVTINSMFMILAGLFNSGPDSILGGALPCKLGELDGKKSGAAVVGLVNGFGTFGSVIQGPLLGFIVQYYGWKALLVILTMASGFGTMFTMVAWLKEKKMNISRVEIDSNTT